MTHDEMRAKMAEFRREMLTIAENAGKRGESSARWGRRFAYGYLAICAFDIGGVYAWPDLDRWTIWYFACFALFFAGQARKSERDWLKRQRDDLEFRQKVLDDMKEVFDRFEV